MMKNEFIIRIISTVIILPLVLFFIIKGSFFFLLFLILIFFIASYEWYMMSNKKKYQIPGYLFLICSFYSAYSLRNDFGGDKESLLTFLFILTICILTDIGGYLFGKIFKGPKLTKLSPNKTFSGMIGGYSFSILIIYLFMKNSIFLLDMTLNWTTEIFIYIFLISTVSQIGDITISYFKRQAKIKDTGKIIPGHGGILDRVDGIIFAFPFSYIMSKYNILIF